MYSCINFNARTIVIVEDQIELFTYLLKKNKRQEKRIYFVY